MGFEDYEPRFKQTNFRCDNCKTSFHIKARHNAIWERYMPPRFCPKCGVKVEGGKDGD